MGIIVAVAVYICAVELPTPADCYWTEAPARSVEQCQQFYSAMKGRLRPGEYILAARCEDKLSDNRIWAWSAGL